jgi:hypothetical protein
MWVALLKEVLNIVDKTFQSYPVCLKLSLLSFHFIFVQLMSTHSNANKWDNYIVTFNSTLGDLPSMFDLLARHHQGHNLVHNNHCIYNIAL